MRDINETILILDTEEDLEVLDTTPGWNCSEEWVPFVVPAGKYRAKRALNPYNPDGTWFFIDGTRFGQREDWLLKAESDGIKARLLETKPAEEEMIVNVISG